jgi:hypothetical protein
MVDLDHIILGSFTVSSDNGDTKVISTIQLKFGAARAVKQVKTSGNWFITWGLYTQVALFTFLHRKSELETYGLQILSLFTATSPNNHNCVIALDKAIRVQVGNVVTYCSWTMPSLTTSGYAGSTQLVQTLMKVMPKGKPKKGWTSDVRILVTSGTTVSVAQKPLSANTGISAKVARAPIGLMSYVRKGENEQP